MNDKKSDDIINIQLSGIELDDNEDYYDPLYEDAIRIVTESQRASISGLQRRLKIGYNRSARLIDAMEAAGIVSHLDSAGSRTVLIAKTDTPSEQNGKLVSEKEDKSANEYKTTIFDNIDFGEIFKYIFLVIILSPFTALAAFLISRLVFNYYYDLFSIKALLIGAISSPITIPILFLIFGNESSTTKDITVFIGRDSYSGKVTKD